MDQQQLIEMDGGAFAEWAEQEYGVDYDDVCLWDMLASLDGRPGELLSEQPASKIPSGLRDILIARKAARPAPRPAPRLHTREFSEWELRDGTAE